MKKSAITIDEQLTLLQKRGLTVIDIPKAKEVLGDIGYYRLGFYLFPFECSYPQLHKRTHEYKEGAVFEDAVRLYYFDFDLRNLLLKYISRIEVHFRTALTYEGSINYSKDSCWFVNPDYVDETFIKAFDRIVYTGSFKRNPTIKRHHKKYPAEKYAPAWKTIEFMTLGENVQLFSSLLNNELKQRISNQFGIRYVDVFDNYMELVRILRNSCAHGNVLFDFKPYKRIKRGPASLDAPEEYMNLYGSIKVIRYLLSQISENRAKDMMMELQQILDKYTAYPEIAKILEVCAGLQDRVVSTIPKTSLISKIFKFFKKLFSQLFGFLSRKH